MTQDQARTFVPGEHLQKIQGKEYLPVRWRLVWFHQATGPRAGYITVELEHDRQSGFAKFFTVAWDGSEEHWRHLSIRGVEVDVCGRVATGEGSETRADFGDYYEKAATKSLGRALAGLSFGTQFAPEFDERHRVVDTPVERNERPSAPVRGAPSGPLPASGTMSMRSFAPAEPAQPGQERERQTGEDSEPAANEQQLMSIRKLCAALGREEPPADSLTFAGASALIRQLSREYNAARRAS